MFQHAMSSTRFLLIASPLLLLAFLLNTSKEEPEVRESAKMHVVSPDGKWAATLRSKVIGPESSFPLPIDTVTVEPNIGKKYAVQPVFVVQWQAGQSYQLTWLSETELRISYPREAKAITRDTQSREVRVTYESL